MRRNARGNALAISLMVLAVLVVMMIAVGTLGAQHLSLVRSHLQGATALYAAEAGVAAALIELEDDSGWSAGFQNIALNGELQPRYSVQVTNNFLGATPVAAQDGTSVPPGSTYVLGIGTCLSGTGLGATPIGSPRKVAVMLTGGGGGFNYAIACGGGPVNIKAHGDIYGNIKSNTNIVLDGGSINVLPLNGQGRVLCAYDPANPPPLTGNITVNSNLEVAAGQDVRARSAIVGTVSPAGVTFPFDTTADTEPFWNGQTPAPNPGQETLPNPDRSVLLSGAVVHTESSYPNGKDKTLELNDQVHYFPNGLTMGSGTKIEGPGIIVIGNGKTGEFNIPINGEISFVALDKEHPLPSERGQARLVFQANTVIRGLIYSHGAVESKAQLDVTGSIISYAGGGWVHTGASLDVRLEPANLTVPGFEEWFGQGGAGGFTLQSWQRL